MPSKAVIRRSLLLPCAAVLAAGGLMRGGQVRAELPVDGRGLERSTFVQPSDRENASSETTRLRVAPPEMPAFDDQGSAVAALSPSWGRPITQAIAGREQFTSAVAKGTSVATESAAVPLPPAAWTGLTSLLGLGAIGIARNLRRTMK
jgi:hypothetical protein